MNGKLGDGNTVRPRGVGSCLEYSMKSQQSPSSLPQGCSLFFKHGWYTSDDRSINTPNGVFAYDDEHHILHGDASPYTPIGNIAGGTERRFLRAQRHTHS